MERRVKTGHLWQFWMTLAEYFDQFDLTGQMIRVVRADAMQFIQQWLRHHLGFGMLHAVDHTMSHGLHGLESILSLEPIQQEICGRFVIGGGEALIGLRCSILKMKR